MSPDDLHNRQPDASANGDAAAAADALVDRLTAAVRDMPVPDGPDEQTLAVTLAALRTASAEAASPLRGGPFLITQAPQRNRIMKPLLKLALAACLVLAAGVVFLAAPWGNSLAFAKVVEQVKQAGSVKYKMTATVTLPGGKTMTGDSTNLIVGNRLRQEMPNAVQLMDFDAGQMLMLQPAEKTAMRLTMRNMPPDVAKMNLLDQFRKIDPAKAKDIGEREFDGRKLRGFEIHQPGQQMTVWADPRTRTPVRIETTIDMPSVPHTTGVMTDFVWDSPDVKELTLDVPEGYKVQSLEVDASPPVEKDLVEGLRAMATLCGGEFPQGFDMTAIGEAVKKRVPKVAPTPEQKAARSEALQAELVPQILKISRALAFVSDPNGDDWHYAGGAGAKLGEAGRPVLWYKPKGADKYRVIHADLSIRDAAPDALPKIEAKQLTPGASPFSAMQKPADPPKAAEPSKAELPKSVDPAKRAEPSKP